MSGTEQRGVCAGGKKPTARSIKQDFETFFESFKIRTAWRKDFFDTLRRALAARLLFFAILQFGYRISFDFPRGIVYHIG